MVFCLFVLSLQCFGSLSDSPDPLRHGPLKVSVVSGTKMLATDPLSPVFCDVDPPWMTLVCPGHPTDARLD